LAFAGAPVGRLAKQWLWSGQSNDIPVIYRESLDFDRTKSRTVKGSTA
jgi:hypothetical protein